MTYYIIQLGGSPAGDTSGQNTHLGIHAFINIYKVTDSDVSLFKQYHGFRSPRESEIYLEQYEFTHLFAWEAIQHPFDGVLYRDNQRPHTLVSSIDETTMSEIFVRIELMIDYINNADIKYPNGPLAYDNNSNSVYHSFLYAMSGFGAADAAHRLRVDDQGNLMPYGQGGETFEKYADAHILLSDEPFLGGNTNFLPTSFGFAYDDQGMSPVSAYGAKISS